MNIVITNTVTLNGGDFAILQCLMNVLKQTFGSSTEITVYDSHPTIASRYYPHVRYRKTLYDAYKKNESRKLSKRLNATIQAFYPLNRLKIAARLYGGGRKFIAKSILNKSEYSDLQIYANADLIVSTGGTYLVENYPLDARIFDFDFSLALKKPLVLFTQSLGPFNKPENKVAFKRIFDASRFIFLRDAASLQNILNINGQVGGTSRICGDVVFTDASIKDLENGRIKSMGSPIRVGISVRSWKFFKERSLEEGQLKYYDSIRAICCYIAERQGGEVVFISTCQAIKEYHVDDSKTAEEIVASLPEDVRSRVHVNKEFNTPDQFKEIVKGFDLFISTRMHGAIQSLNVGVPVLPIAYEFKTKELFSQLMDPKFILDIDTISENEAVSTLTEFIDYVEIHRNELFDKVLKQHLSSLEPIKILKEILPYAPPDKV